MRAAAAAAAGEASSSFARLMRRDGTLVGAEIVATAAVSLVRPEILGRVAEWDVSGELALEAEVERARHPITAARRPASARLLLLRLEQSSLERVKVELGRKVLGKRSSRTHAHVVAPQVVSFALKFLGLGMPAIVAAQFKTRFVAGTPGDVTHRLLDCRLHLSSPVYSIVVVVVLVAVVVVRAGVVVAQRCYSSPRRLAFTCRSRRTYVTGLFLRR